MGFEEQSDFPKGDLEGQQRNEKTCVTQTPVTEIESEDKNTCDNGNSAICISENTNLASVEDAYRIPLFCSSLVGLLIVQEGRDGYEVNRRALFSMTIGICFSIAAMSPPIYAIIMKPPFWLVVLTMPYLAGYGFCLISYFHVLAKFKSTIEYMEALKKVRVPRGYKHKFLMVSTFLYPVVMAVTSLSFLPDLETLLYLIPSFAMRLIPAILDMQMGSLIITLRKLLGILEQTVISKTNRPTRLTGEEIQEVSDNWLNLNNLVNIHNKIFRSVVHIRLILLVAESMAYLFVLWAMERYDSECITLVVLISVPLCEVVFRLFSLCTLGEAILVHNDRVIMAVTEAIYKDHAYAPQPRLALTHLVARMEARPPSIENYGMECLSARTFVNLSGMVVTYLVVLMQFCQKSRFRDSFEGDDPFTRFDGCFCSNQSVVHGAL